MKVMWLNESLLFRAENQREKKALAVLHDCLAKGEGECLEVGHSADVVNSPPSGDEAHD